MIHYILKAKKVEVSFAEFTPLFYNLTFSNSDSGEHTSALLDAWPLKGSSRYIHVIMIGLSLKA